jgi:hypothetical protein
MQLNFKGAIVKISLDINLVNYVVDIHCCHAHRILPCTMEGSKDHPPLETWQTSQRTYFLQADKPFTHSIQSL